MRRRGFVAWLLTLPLLARRTAAEEHATAGVACWTASIDGQGYGRGCEFLRLDEDEVARIAKHMRRTIELALGHHARPTLPSGAQFLFSVSLRHGVTSAQAYLADLSHVKADRHGRVRFPDSERWALERTIRDLLRSAA